MRIPGRLAARRTKHRVQPISRPGLSSAVPDCSFYPVQIDLTRRTLQFARISREVYRSEGFLTPRAGDLGRGFFSFNLDDLLLAGAPLRPPGARIHFILISAFCCSTLLARYFDLVPGCHVLREPGLLGQLSNLRGSKTFAGPWRVEEWPQLAEMGMGLLARTFEPGETVVIKAADITNIMADWLADWHPEGRFVLLSVPLRLFILSVLKNRGRRAWARQRARFWRHQARMEGLLPDSDVARLDDARRAAYLWLATELYWGRLRRRIARARTLAVDGDEVSNAPAQTVARLGEFFEVPIPKHLPEEIESSRTASRHAKEPGRAYGAAQRQSDISRWEIEFGAQADAAVEWAMRLAGPGVVR